MRDPDRLDAFYDEIKKIHKEKFPDWRFIQLMQNFMGWYYTKTGLDGFYFEEDKTLILLREFTNEMIK